MVPLFAKSEPKTSYSDIPETRWDFRIPDLPTLAVASCDPETITSFQETLEVMLVPLMDKITRAPLDIVNIVNGFTQSFKHLLTISNRLDAFCPSRLIMKFSNNPVQKWFFWPVGSIKRRAQTCSTLTACPWSHGDWLKSPSWHGRQLLHHRSFLSIKSTTCAANVMKSTTCPTLPNTGLCKGDGYKWWRFTFSEAALKECWLVSSAAPVHLHPLWPHGCPQSYARPHRESQALADRIQCFRLLSEKQVQNWTHYCWWKIPFTSWYCCS